MNQHLPFATLSAISSGKPVPNDRTEYVVWSRTNRGEVYSREVTSFYSEAELISDLRSKQFDDVVRIVAYNTAEGWSRDVTDLAEIAEAIHGKEVETSDA